MLELILALLALLPWLIGLAMLLAVPFCGLWSLLELARCLVAAPRPQYGDNGLRPDRPRG